MPLERIFIEANLNNHLIRIQESSIPSFSLIFWASPPIIRKSILTSTHRMRLMATRQQKSMSMLMLMRIPTGAVMSIRDMAGRKVIADTCEDLSLSPNSTGRVIIRLQHPEQVIPNTIDPKRVAAVQKPKMCRAKSMTLQITIPLMSRDRLVLIFLLLLAIINLTMVSIIQKRVPHTAAFQASKVLVSTAQEGSQPEADIQMPTSRKKASPIYITRLLLTSFLFSPPSLQQELVQLCSGGGYEAFSRAISTLNTAKAQQELTPMNLTMRGESRAPTPNIPWAKGIQDPALSPETSSRQKLLMDTMTQLAAPIMKKEKSYPVGVCQRMNRSIIRAITIPLAAMVLCSQAWQVLWMRRRAMSPRTLPMVLAVKRMEYSVSGLFRYWARKGMMGPILPTASPELKRVKEQMAKQRQGSTAWAFPRDIFVNIFYLLVDQNLTYSTRYC